MDSGISSELSHNLILTSQTTLMFQGKTFPCAIGKGGIKIDKVEGDGATPVGSFPLKEVFYREDHMGNIPTPLLKRPIQRNFGWCDDAKDPCYNQRVMLPYVARHEELWREDHLYDIVVVVGYNTNPIVPGKGSAIFIHVARPADPAVTKDPYSLTDGCVSLAASDLLAILKDLSCDAHLIVNPLS